MSGYSVADVAKILDLSPEQVRGFVRQGLVPALRGPRGEYRFSFQDLLVLRTARGLKENAVPMRRVKDALRALRAQLPEGQPVSAVQVFAEGCQVVVHDDAGKWEPASGQTLFDFDVADLEARAQAVAAPLDEPAPAPVASLRPVAVPEPDPDRDLDADDWLEVGLELEPTVPDRARDAYRRALERDPMQLEARVNLGRLLHDHGLLEAAAAHYDLALRLHPEAAVAHFNLGVLLEDQGDTDGAQGAYQRAIELEPDLREAHLNLARLYERLGKKQLALQTLAAFKRL
ncbi:MAG: tetratricopeptide repeat protein [Myxococcales bacterium]|nr:tetratricopeptide repeat protein [Myxococcales bacterium]